MNYKQESNFSFLQGFFSIFFGTRYGRMKSFYEVYKKQSETEAIREDFQKIGNDMRKVMKKEAKKNSLQRQECDL